MNEFRNVLKVSTIAERLTKTSLVLASMGKKSPERHQWPDKDQAAIFDYSVR